MKEVSIALVYGANNAILMGKRRDTNKWNFIGGGLEGNETPAECVAREVFEEVGVNMLPENYKYISTTETEEGIKLHLFEIHTRITWNDDIFTTTFDPDGEFGEIDFFPVEYVKNLAKDDKLHIPANKNIAYQHLFAEENTPSSVFKKITKAVFGGLFEVETDDVTLDALSFKEKRELQKELEQNFTKLEKNPSFKEKRELQKRNDEIFALLEEENIGQENTGFDFVTAEHILSKNTDALTSNDMDWFFEDGKLDELEKLIAKGDKKALSLEKLAKKVNDELNTLLDSIDIMFDNVDVSQLQDLLGDAFLDITPRGKVDEKKREKAIAKLRKKLKTDNQFRDAFKKLVESANEN